MKAMTLKPEKHAKVADEGGFLNIFKNMGGYTNVDGFRTGYLSAKTHCTG